MSFSIEGYSGAPDHLTEMVRGWLDQHSVQHGVHRQTKDLVGVANADNRPIGVLAANHEFDWMFVALLAVDPDHRGKGVGAALLDWVEAQAKAAGCIGIWLDSFTYEGVSYYPRHGFREFGRMQDHPPGHARVFFEKRF